MHKYGTSSLQQIRQLRTSGLTYREINQELGLAVPKSTLSYMCRGIAPGGDYAERMKGEAHSRLKFIRTLAAQKNKEIFAKKLAEMDTNTKYVFELMQDKRVAKIALAMLYLGEGAKWQGTRGLRLGSSDPKIITDYLNLLTFCFDVNRDKIRCRVQHRADQDSEKLISFWSNITGVPKKHFYPCYVDRRTIGHKTRKFNYKGVCSIMCPGTIIQLELSVIADKIYKVWGISAVG